MEGPDKNNKPSKPPVGERFQPKVLVIWLIIFSGIALLWNMTDRNASTGEVLTMYKVIEAAKDGEFNQSVGRRLQIESSNKGEDWYRVSGKIHPQRIRPESRENDLVSFRAEGKLTDDNYELLQEYNFKEKPSNTQLMAIFWSFLPFYTNSRPHLFPLRPSA